MSATVETIRAEIAVGQPGDCPVARTSATDDSPVTDVVRATVPDTTGRLPEEFAVVGELPDTVGAPIDDPAVEPIVSTDGHRIYRFSRDPAEPCVCAAIEEFGHPVTDVNARDGTLFVAIHAPDVETIRTILARLEESFDDVRIRHLVPVDGPSSNERVLVDRGRLTDRQREVLETASEMGYFEHPKRANAGDVAAALDIATSTFTEHLAAAQRKILEDLLRP